MKGGEITTDWPISIREAARRLGIPFNTASILVRANPPIRTVPNYTGAKYKGLYQEAFAQLREKAVPFIQTKNEDQPN